MYIDSENIRLFPFAKYRPHVMDLGSRLFYENNISRLITQLIDTEGFIISGSIRFDKTTNDVLVDTLLCFNIHGYYFEIDPGVSILPSNDATEIYAYIKLTEQVQDSESNEISPPELEGQDEILKFTGLTIDTTIPEGAIGIKIATKDGDQWKIPESSFYKFSSESLNISKIDGKH